MQGIFFGDKQRVGYDRMVIRDNDVHVGLPHGIAISTALGATIRGNRVSSIVGAVNLRNQKQIKANVTILNSSGEVCGNEVVDIPHHEATRSCQ